MKSAAWWRRRGRKAAKSDKKRGFQSFREGDCLGRPSEWWDGYEEIFKATVQPDPKAAKGEASCEGGKCSGGNDGDDPMEPCDKHRKDTVQPEQGEGK